MFPHICANNYFLQFLIGEWIKLTAQRISEVKPKNVFEALTAAGLDDKHQRTVLRAVCDLKKKSVGRITESERKVESYIRYLNGSEQYGCLLYNNGELIVPSIEGESDVKHCPLSGTPVFCSSVPACRNSFWEELQDFEPGTEEKSVLMTFEANADAVYAFQYSLPCSSIFFIFSNIVSV